MITSITQLRWQQHWNELIIACEEIAGLVHANVPLAGGLLALAGDAPTRRLHGVFNDLGDDIGSGLALHEAMRNREDFFPNYCIECVRAGEESGRLKDMLGDLQKNLMESLAFRSRAQDVGIYLFTLIIIELLIILMILTFVAPQFEEIFRSFDHSVPFMARVLMEMQGLGIPHLLLGFALVTPILWLLAQYSSLREGRLARGLDRFFSRFPFLRGRLRERHLGNAAAIAEMLVRAGLPLHHAFRSAGGALPAASVRKALEALATQLEQGTSLKEALQRQRKEFPASFRELLSLGEAGGQVPDALRQIRELYQRRTLRNARVALEIGGPALLCLIGGGDFHRLQRLLLLDHAPAHPD